MFLYSHKDISKVFMVGDIHGNFKQFFHKIKMSTPKKCDIVDEKILKDETLEYLKPHLDNLNSYLANTFINYEAIDRSQNIIFENCLIIVAGDCGFGFEKEAYYHQIFSKYITMLEENNIFIYFVRGNHDDPTYFSECKINYSNIKSIPDYSVIETENDNILCVGGAISIDRSWRKQEEFRINKHKKNGKKLYWENEAPFFSEEKLNDILDNISINCVVTHSSTSFMPLSKDNLEQWAKMDKNVMEDTTKERETLTLIYEYLIKREQKLKCWFHGHFHYNHLYEVKGMMVQSLNDSFKFVQIPTNIKEMLDPFSSLNSYIPIP